MGTTEKWLSQLLDLAERSKGRADRALNDVSVRENLLATLEIETKSLEARDEDDCSESAGTADEGAVPKTLSPLFNTGASGKGASLVLAAIICIEGYDARGISTLGNFIAEFAVSEGKKAFNVGAFGAGSRATLFGNASNADERHDELAFALLADKAKYSATLFDLRSVRALLHQVLQEKRSALQTNLIYWADSYDALICYGNVTLLKL